MKNVCFEASNGGASKRVFNDPLEGGHLGGCAETLLKPLFLELKPPFRFDSDAWKHEKGVLTLEKGV